MQIDKKRKQDKENKRANNGNKILAITNGEPEPVKSKKKQAPLAITNGERGELPLKKQDSNVSKSSKSKRRSMAPNLSTGKLSERRANS